MHTTEPLITAIRKQRHAEVYDYIKQGVDVNAKHQGYTPLMIAVGLKDAEIVKTLLDNGADTHILNDATGVSALHIAAQGGNVDIAKMLVEHGAFINLQAPLHGFTPLFNAIWYRQPQMVEYLLGLEDIDIEIVSAIGVKARDVITAIGTMKGLSDEAEVLQLEHTKQMERAFAAYGERRAKRLATQTLMKVITNEAGHDEETQLLAARQAIADGADVNARYPVLYQPNDAHTPLLVAARDGLGKVVQLLLEHGADITATCGHMRANAAHKAAYFGHADILKILAAHPEFPRIRDAQGSYNGYTPLIDATWHGHTDAVKVLLEAGADQNLVALDGHTALTLAQRFKVKEIVAVLANS